jgi:hypothetical protein
MTRRKNDPIRTLTEEERDWLERIRRSHNEPAGHVARAKKFWLWQMDTVTRKQPKWQAYTFWHFRWTIENCGFRELKEGWHLEEALWTFRYTDIAADRLTFTLIA